MTAIDVSEYILQYASGKGQQITNLKLQKILYYVQGYSLGLFEAPIIEDDFVHWQYGPVCQSAYFQFSTNGAEYIIPSPAAPSSLGCSGSMQRKLDKVINACLWKTARELVDMTHNEAPWRNTADREVISQSSIRQYFTNHDPLKIK
ncbi:type II toxin-antitoxin system antitoxin SocA domain-containing protein [Oscillospiraceae bacterium 52-8]